jgi:hypothetical protein
MVSAVNYEKIGCKNTRVYVKMMIEFILWFLSMLFGSIGGFNLANVMINFSNADEKSDKDEMKKYGIIYLSLSVIFVVLSFIFTFYLYELPIECEYYGYRDCLYNQLDYPNRNGRWDNMYDLTEQQAQNIRDRLNETNKKDYKCDVSQFEYYDWMTQSERDNFILSKYR